MKQHFFLHFYFLHISMNLFKMSFCFYMTLKVEGVTGKVMLCFCYQCWVLLSLNFYALKMSGPCIFSNVKGCYKFDRPVELKNFLAHLHLISQASLYTFIENVFRLFIVYIIMFCVKIRAGSMENGKSDYRKQIRQLQSHEPYIESGFDTESH